jgi:hypothetical protein
MGVERAPKIFAHRVGSYKDIHVGMLGTNTGRTT